MEIAKISTAAADKGLRRLRYSIDERTEEQKQAAFLGAFMETHNLRAAMAHAQVTYSAVLGWRKFDQNFKNAYEEIINDLCAALEAECYRRAMHGVKKPIFQNGEQVGEMVVYSDDLLKFLMKGMMPDKYREKLTVEKNNTTQNTVLVLPQNGREMKLPAGVDVGKFGDLVRNEKKPDVRDYIPEENIAFDTDRGDTIEDINETLNNNE